MIIIWIYGDLQMMLWWYHEKEEVAWMILSYSGNMVFILKHTTVEKMWDVSIEIWRWTMIMFEWLPVMLSVIIWFDGQSKTLTREYHLIFIRDDFTRLTGSSNKIFTILAAFIDLLSSNILILLPQQGLHPAQFCMFWWRWWCFGPWKDGDGDGKGDDDTFVVL